MLFFYEYTYYLSIQVFTNGWIEEGRFPLEKHRGIFYCQEPKTFENVQTGHHATDWEKRVLERKETVDKQFSDIRFQCQISLLGK